MSTFAHTRNNVTAALRDLASQAPNFQVQRVTPIGSRFARVLGTISAKATPDQVMAAVRKLNPHATPVKGSFVSIASNGLTMSLEGIVGVLDERIVLSETNRDSFTAVAANMYMDEEERLWSLKKTDAGDILIKSHANDEMEIMNGLMACVASTNTGVQEALPASAQLAGQRAQIQGGDLMTYVSPTAGHLVMGFAVAAAVNEAGEDQGLVAVSQDGTTEQIDRMLVVAYAQGADVESDDTAELEAVASGRPSMEMIREYYRKVFIRSPAYFEKFWSRFSSHAFM